MNDSTELDRLWAALDRPNASPGQLATLSAEQLVSLRESFTDAKARQRAAMQEAIDNAMKYIPAPLRKPVLKILRGS